MNEAIFCTTNILKDNKGKNNMWTIISANDELRMVELYGRHTETITFLQEMEFWNQNKEVVIPTERVYFYIEKKPLTYAGGYNGEIPLPCPECTTGHRNFRNSIQMNLKFILKMKILSVTILNRMSIACIILQLIMDIIKRIRR